MEMKDLLGGKGANLAEMTSVLGLPVPPGFTITTDACRAYLDDGLARRPRRRGRQGTSARLETDDGQAARRPRRPAARERPVRRQVLDARDDGHGPQPRPQRRVGRGPGRRRPTTSASPTTPTAASSPMYGRIVLDIDGERVRRACSTRPRTTTASTDDAEVPRRAAAAPVRARTRTSSSSDTGKPFPQDPAEQLRGAIEAVFRSLERRPRRSPTATASASPTTSAPR